MIQSDGDFEPAAGNGVMDRRFFLQAGTASGALLMTASASAVERPPWMRLPGAGLSEEGAPSAFEAPIKRINVNPRPGTTGSGIIPIMQADDRPGLGVAVDERAIAGGRFRHSAERGGVATGFRQFHQG